jgi:hypothetical protein
MDELHELVRSSAIEFAPDIAQWVSPPKSPDRPAPQKRRVAIRNSVAFGISMVVALTVSVFAVTGNLPSWIIWFIIATLGLSVSTRNWKTESKGADEEEAILLETHAELYRAYLHRKKVWSRLHYCFKCSVVIDPQTYQTRSLYDIHELSNNRTSGVSLR